MYGYSRPFTISGIAVDSFEVDDSLSRASAIPTNGTIQNRTLNSGDVDWIKFDVQKDSLYFIRIAGTINPYVYLYAAAESSYTMYKSGTNVLIFWKATVTKTSYLRVVPYSTSSIYYGSYTANVKKTAEDAVLTFVNPTGSSVLSTGNLYQVQWVPDTALFPSYSYVYLYRDQSLVSTISLSAYNGSVNWTVPAGLATGGNYRIKVVNGSVTNGPYAFSPYFTISGIMPDTFENDNQARIAKPIKTDGEVQLHNLTLSDTDWVSFAAQNGMLYVVNDACSTSTSLRLYGADTVTLLQNATGYLTTSPKIVWFCTVPGTYFASVTGSSTGNYRLSVTANDSSVYKLRVNKPAAGDTVRMGAFDTIQWDSQVSVGGYVDIFLYDSHGVIATIVANDPNDGSYAWNVPAALTPGNTYYIKIISRFYASIQGSGAPFVIAGP